MKKKQSLRNQHGMVLISTFLMISIIGTYSFALFTKNLAACHASERTANRITAFQEAESALDQAIVQLRNNQGYAGQGYTAFSRGGYDIQVETPDQDHNPHRRRITVNGHAPSNLTTARAYERRQVVAYVDFLPRTSSFAIFSDTSIQMSGNAQTDSYDSRNGPYASQTPGNHGDMGTNTTQAGFVTLSGNVRIGGNALVGPGGNPSSVIRTSGNAQIAGSRTAASSLTSLDPVQVPTNLTNQGSLTVNGNTTMTLTSGTYWYSSISISGNGSVQFTGPATLYVTGNVSISGNGFSTAQNLPPNLTIKIAGTRSVSFTGNANFYGSVYAPDSGLQITGNGGIFGAVTGDSIQLSGNGKIHYDEALNTNGTSNGNKSTLVAWTEA